MKRSNWGKLALLAVLTTLLVIPSTLLAEVSSVQTMPFSSGSLSFTKVKGYDVVRLKDCYSLTEAGMPNLPSKEVKVALPAGMAAKSVRVVNTTSVIVDGKYNVFPTQPPQKVGSSQKEADFVGPDQAVYASAEAYPANLVEFVGQTDLAGQGIAIVRVNPVQYVPAEGKLTLYTSISFIIEGVGGYECGDYLPASISDLGRGSYEQTLRDMVINPEEVQLVVAEAPFSTGVEPGDYDYVIITDASWVDDFQPLADWKTQKGMAANIVTTYWIYNQGGYGGSNVDKIRAFVIDAHSTWGATFFLLGGDTGYIPYHTRNIGDNIPNDTYYSDYDDDWTCEVHVGRASVTSTSQIDTFIDKVFTYEQDPPLTNYAEKAGLFGFDLNRSGSGEGEGLMENIDAIIPYTWSVTKVYDSHSGNHYTNVMSAMNGGQNLLAHMDHSSEDFMGTGYINHGWGLGNGDMDGLYNGDRQSILYTGGCDAGDYTVSACIIEHFVRNTNGGGVASIGNSRYGWYTPYDPDTYSLLYERLFFRSLFEQGHYRLGDCSSDHKNDGPKTDNTYRYIYTELTLLGDPELPIWTEDPGSFNVSHPSTLPTGPSSFTVHVEAAGGGNVDQAYVCLWKGEEVYLTGNTNSSGDVTFTPSPSTEGTMYVTASKHNYIPYQGSAEVTGGAPMVSIELVPDHSPVIVPRGGSFGFTGTVTNNTDQFQRVDLWLMAYVPGVGMYGPLKRFNNVPFNPYQARNAHLNQAIPNSAPISDQYVYYGYVGDYPSTKIDSSYFPFEVTAKGLARAGGGDWVLTGSFLEGDLTDLPCEFALLSNYPNPFNAQTVIEYQLPVSSSVKLEVYNLLGSKVATLVDGEQQAGYKSVTWDASEVSSGVYFYKLTAGDYTETKRMMLVK
jgi:hypothetical protein